MRRLSARPRSGEHSSLSPDVAPVTTNGAASVFDDPSYDPDDWRNRIFGSATYFRLWIAQVVSATGDWMGFVAITLLARRIGIGDSEGVAISVVLAARIVPGFFLAPLAGVLVDRWDRKRVMVWCDIGRAAVLFSLPFVDSIYGLVAASFVLELLTLLWAPAKEASVPNLVPAEKLSNANSLALVAAYATFPIGSGLASVLTKVGDWVGSHQLVDNLRATGEGLVLYADGLTFLATALIVSRLAIPSPQRHRDVHIDRKLLDLGHTFRELREGWQFIFIDPVVRAVIFGLAVGLLGGGMLVPLGPSFATDVLGAGRCGLHLVLDHHGLRHGLRRRGGVAHRQLCPPEPGPSRCRCSLLAVALMLAASLSSLALVALVLVALGFSAGAVYVLGFTLMHERTDDELRGRIFSLLFTLVRLCLLIAFAVGPLIAEGLGALSARLVDERLSVPGGSIYVPGVRLTLWLAAMIILGAGVFILRSIRRDEPPSSQT